MIETLRLIENFKKDGRELDRNLVQNRQSIVQRNLSQVEGRQRSPKYVGRLAGFSPDIDRKSRTETAVEWYGSTAFEDPTQALLISQFWQNIFQRAAGRPVLMVRDFWEVQEETNAYLSQVRNSFISGNKIEARFALVQILQNVNLMLRLVDTAIPGVVVMGAGSYG